MDQQQIPSEDNRSAEQPQNEPAKYIFPNFVASTMAKTSPKVQYESSMMGTFLLLISITLTTIFYVGFSPISWLYKGFIIFNAIAGFLMLSSMLVTTYQQYNQYMGAVALEKAIYGYVEGEKSFSGKKVRAVRYISAIVETAVIIVAAIFLWQWIAVLLLHPLYLMFSTESYIKKHEQPEVKNV